MTGAFVLGLFDTGLAVVRALARHGIPVFGFDHRARQPGFHSRYGTHEVCPDPAVDPEGLLRLLRSRAETQAERPVLYPTSDAFVSFLSTHRESLATHCRFTLPSRDAVNAAMDKGRQYATAAAAGVPTASTCTPATLAEVREISTRLSYPVIVKPHVGHVWRASFRRDKAIRVESATELVSLFTEVMASGHAALIQSLIVGPNTNHCKVCAYLDANGTPLAMLCMRKIRQYPVDFGVGTMMESVEEPALEELGLRFLRAMDWRGPGSIEFKRDDCDGHWKLIELNPRLWQQNGFAADAGVNFPLIQYRDLTGGEAPPQRYRIGVRWIDEFRDPQSAWQHRQRGLLGIGQWLTSMRQVRSYALWAKDDPGPFLASAKDRASAVWRRARAASSQDRASGKPSPAHIARQSPASGLEHRRQSRITSPAARMRERWRYGASPPVTPWGEAGLRVLADSPGRFSERSWRDAFEQYGAHFVKDIELRVVGHPAARRRLLAEADVYLTATVRGEDLAAARRLRLLHLLTAGTESLDRVTLPVSIAVASCKGVAARGLAEHALSLMLALSRGLPRALERQRRWRWSQAGLLGHVVELRGRSAGILGLGHAGRELAALLLGLGMKVLTWDGRDRPAPPPAGVTAVRTLPELLGLSDFVILCLPETPSTRGIVDQAALAAMRPGAMIINVSRGRLIDSGALAAALKSGRIAGAGLDVLDHEPPGRFHPLRGAPNLIVTPHIAGNMHVYQREIQHRCVENVGKLLRGEALLSA